MKKQPAKFNPSLRLTRRSFSRIACFGTVILIYSSAFAQNLFMTGSDASGGKIFEFTPSRVQSTFASGLSSPGALAFDSAGNLFVGDVSVGNNGITSGTIYKFTPAGVRSTFAVGLSYPFSLAFDSNGNLFVADNGNILKFTPNGVRSPFVSGFSGPLAFDSAGNLFVASYFIPDGRPAPSPYIIYKFTPHGARSTFASGNLSTDGVVAGLVVDRAGNLYLVDGGEFVDGGGSAIYKFTSGGKRSALVFGQNCDFGSLAIDSMGNLFVTDDCTGIDKLTPQGNRSVFASVMGAGLAFQPAQTLPASHLTNISTRLHALTDSNALIGGFIISGTGDKKVLLRALGQTLTNFGITDALQDPTIELHDGAGAMIASNDNWKDTQQAQITATGLAPPNDLESAILATLAPGSYTAIVRGKNATTGTALVEAYDVDGMDNAYLTNTSTRGFVGLDNGVMIAGFIVSQGGSANVVVRALGPTLAQFGVTGALQDPTLTMYDANGTQIASNNNWKDTQQALIQASGLAPLDDRESAIEETLTPGNYTIVERGSNNTTGVGLIEVYKLP